jgi:hypothetical protein
MTLTPVEHRSSDVCPWPRNPELFAFDPGKLVSGDEMGEALSNLKRIMLAPKRISNRRTKLGQRSAPSSDSHSL